MRYLLSISMIFSILCISCGSSSNSSSITYQNPHSKIHQEMRDELYHEKNRKQLEGTWLIKQVYDIQVDSLMFDGKQPSMQIDVSTETLSGNDGCNLFQGKVKFKEDKIIFGPTAGTLMACPNAEISGKIMKSFSEKELTYALKDVLIFYKGDQQVMVLKQEE